MPIAGILFSYQIRNLVEGSEKELVSKSEEKETDQMMANARVNAMESPIVTRLVMAREGLAVTTVMRETIPAEMSASIARSESRTPPK